MQVTEAEDYRLLAEENRINVRLIPPSRGIIYDRFGIAIAQNAQNYRIVIVREDAGDVEEAIAKVRRLVNLDDDDVERALKEIYRRSPFVPITVADQLAWEDIAEVAINAPALPGITPDVGLSREYPLGPDFAHIVGMWGRSATTICQSWKTPTRCCRSRSSRSARSGSRPSLRAICAGVRARAGSR